MAAWRIIRRFLANLLFAVGIVFHGLLITVLVNIAFLTYWPQQLHVDPYACFPVPSFIHGRLTLPYTDKYPVAQVASYEDELQGLLHFQFLRNKTSSDGVRLVLVAVTSEAGLSYRIFVIGRDDLLTDIPRLGHLEGRRLIPHTELTIWSDRQFFRCQKQSHLFEIAEDVPTHEHLEALDPTALQAALAEFLMFKSETDIRVLENVDPGLQPLTHAQAQQFAADVIAVSRFYDLPVDYFLGVGAMENDYMDVNGDLTHAVWKTRAQTGDIVLRWRRNHVLVSDFSVGAWQITRETLRAAHRLYLRDSRDYALLPEHLRPPRKLDLNNVSGPVLTTYAGLLLRELLDHYHGNVQKAIGAYNGGTVTPNLRYALAVTSIAEYARRILEHASGLTATGQETMDSLPPAPNGGTIADVPLRLLELPKL
jgi:hypothetical protein